MGTYLNPDKPADLHDVVALYSGGVDSYCMSYLCEPDVLLNVNMGGRYGDLESQRCTAPANFTGRLVKLNCRVIGEQEDGTTSIIPGRNAFLALFGSWYGDTLLLASIYEEAHVGGADKDEGFAAAMAALFDHMLQPQRWLPQGRTVRLLLPVHGLTKAELVGRVLLDGHDPAALAANTFSCYQPVQKAAVTRLCAGTPLEREAYGPLRWQECGLCGACARKWAAFAVWGVDVGYPMPREALHGYIEEAHRLIDKAGAGPIYPPTLRWCQDQFDAWHGVVRPIEAAREYPMWERVRPVPHSFG